MEAMPDRPPPLPGTPIPPDRRLPDGRGKIERITDQSKGLVDDITSWVELKLKLTQLEVQQKVEGKINEVVVKVIPLVFLALAGLFLLVTAALGLGWWLGHPFWGFLIVTVVLGLVGVVLQKKSAAIRKAITGEATTRVAEKRLRPTPGLPPVE